MLLFHLYGEPTHSIYPEPEFRRFKMAGTVGHKPLPAPLEQLKADSRIYFVKTHARPSDDAPAIYLVRDGRDALVSHAHFRLAFRNPHPRRRQLKRLLGGSEFNRTLDRLIRADHFGADLFGGWSDHVLAWTVDRIQGVTVPIRYEDLVQDPEGRLGDALARLGLTPARTGQPLPTFDSLHDRWPDFFRRGKIGAWRDEMPERLQQLFWRRHATAMHRFGYSADAPDALIRVQPPLRGRRGRTRWDIEQDESTPPATETSAPTLPSVSMACLGRHGLWGNTVFQYAFLKTFARQHRLRVEVPEWLGQHLYSHDDAPITRRHPVVVREEISLIYDNANHLGLTIDAARNRVFQLADRFQSVWWLQQPLIGPEEVHLPFDHFDLEGLFMIHTRHLAPHQAYVRSLFQPLPALDEKLRTLLARLRARGKTVIGIHLRRGDFDRLFTEQGWQYVAPMRWYLEWLAGVWRKAEDPVLLICSNDLDAVVPHFAKYHPLTVHDLGGDFPELARPPVPKHHPQKIASFYPEWFLLSHCDRVAISNSTFSFTASMLNERGTRFVRPSMHDNRLVPFDPWNAEPLLFLPKRAALISEWAQQIRITHEGLGPRVALRAARVAQHRYRVILLGRARTCYRRFGGVGLLRELTTPAFYLAARRRYGEGPHLDSTEL